MKIYTKTGDGGKTRLIGGCLVAKSDLRIETYGSVDELNAVLGLVITKINTKGVNAIDFTALRDQLLRIQNELFNLGSLFACEDLERLKTLPVINHDHISRLENEIDRMTAKLTALNNFILPGGSESAALMHLARTVCRRAERNSVKLFEKHSEVELGLVYLNRLSDYFFTAARFLNSLAGISDQPWVK